MVECNRGCGTNNLHWKVVHNNYKLFNHYDLLHICNDGEVASDLAMEKATAKILNELGILEPAQIPRADKPEVNVKNEKTLWNGTADGDPKKMFTITSTANGIAVTGDDKHNAIYLPKVAVSELIKALVDFVC